MDEYIVASYLICKLGRGIH